mgnify:CR=1 FL=1
MNGETTSKNEFFDRFSYLFRLVPIPGDLLLVDLKGNLNDFIVLEILSRCLNKFRIEPDFFVEVPADDFWSGVEDKVRFLFEVRVLGQCIEIVYLSRGSDSSISGILLCSIFLHAYHKVLSISELSIQKSYRSCANVSGDRDG